MSLSAKYFFILFGRIALVVLILWVLIKWQPIPDRGAPKQKDKQARITKSIQPAEEINETVLYETKGNTKVTKVYRSKDAARWHNSISPGERWMLIDREEDPFIEPETSYVEIIEIRSGWVQYKYDNGGIHTDKLKWFISDAAVFKKTEN